jgi:hypothetical protein
MASVMPPRYQNVYHVYHGYHVNACLLFHDVQSNLTGGSQLLQVLDLGAIANPMFKGKGPNMVQGNFAPHFPLKHAQKDLR